MLYLWAAVAAAGGLYSGIAPGNEVALDSVVWTSPDSGWMASRASGDGRVRVWVGRQESAAMERFTQRAPEGADASLDGADESRCDALRCVARVGNLVVSVDGKGAAEQARQMLARVTPYSPWPSIPSVRVQGQRVLLQQRCGFAAFRARYRDVQGSGWVETRSGREGLVHGPLPDAIDVSCWDRFGRLGVVTWIAPPRDDGELAVPVP